MDFRNAQIDLTCPTCGNKFKQALAGLEKDPAVFECPHCHQPFEVDTASLSLALKEVDEGLADLRKALRDLGKG